MIDWLKKRSVSVVFLFLGGLGGFLYWKLIGCSSGTCPITSKWHVSILYGMIMGWLIGDLIASFTNRKPKE
jgi:hypothetical protein